MPEKKASKKQEPEKNIVDALIEDIDPKVRAAIGDYDGDTLIQVALVNIKGAIGNLKQALRTTAALARPPERTDGGRSTDGTARSGGTKKVVRAADGSKKVERY